MKIASFKMTFELCSGELCVKKTVSIYCEPNQQDLFTQELTALISRIPATDSQRVRILTHVDICNIFIQELQKDPLESRAVAFGLPSDNQKISMLQRLLKENAMQYPLIAFEQKNNGQWDIEYIVILDAFCDIFISSPAFFENCFELKYEYKLII